MRDELTWMLFLILPLVLVTSRPVQDSGDVGADIHTSNGDAQHSDEVISVSITSSVAVGRGKGKTREFLEPNDDVARDKENPRQISEKVDDWIGKPNRESLEIVDNLTTKPGESLEKVDDPESHLRESLETVDDLTSIPRESLETVDDLISLPRESLETVEYLAGKSREPLETIDDLVAHETVSATPAIATIDAIVTNNETHEEHSPLAGANIEFIKQLHSKKEARGTHHLEVHPFQLQIKHYMTNESSGLTEHTEPSQIPDEIHEDIENIPLGRSVALSPAQNHIQGLPSERGQGPRLTTVSFNVVHDTPKTISNYNENSKPAPTFPDMQPIYSEPPKVYSQPAQVYSEPAKFYSEPAKVYSEPAKVYSEPAKVYSEPAKVYSEPAKFYSPQASLNLPENVPAIPWQETSSTVQTTPSTTTSVQPEQRPEKNYEVDEKDSVLSDGQRHGVQEGPESCKDDSCKVGYVVEGRQYRKYRVEERTSDGFIVGEYGVVRNEDGALRGVRYTADGDASPRLIYDALMKFLQL